MLKYLLGGVRKGEDIPHEMFGKLVASDGAADDQFGCSVFVSADASTIVVGAHLDDDTGSDSGSAYVFTKQANGSYLEVQKLIASDGAGGDRFGYYVSVSGDGSTIVVGAYFDDDKGADSGSAYVFTKQSDGNYLETQKLTALDGAGSDRFGYSVSVSGDGSAIVVSAYNDDDKGSNSGSAYIFVKQPNGSYLQAQKLTASDGAKGDYFGYSVSVSGDGSTIVVGAFVDASYKGSAYVFTKQSDGNYLQAQKLNALDGAGSGSIGDRFGYSVSTSGDGSTIVVGAYCDDDKGNDSGSAYVFTKQANGSYLQTHKIGASDRATSDYFGRSVSVSGDGSTIVASSYTDDDKGKDSGSAYIFTKQANGSYLETQKLTASDGAAGDQFGNSVSVSGDGSTIVVGAPQDDDKGSASGSAYVFK